MEEQTDLTARERETLYEGRDGGRCGVGEEVWQKQQQDKDGEASSQISQRASNIRRIRKRVED